VVRLVNIDSIKIAEEQRRCRDIEPLMVSIFIQGLIQPVVLNANFDLKAGGRRVEACRRLGWKNIPAIICEEPGEEIPSEQRSVIDQLPRYDENLVRAPLSPIEECTDLACQKDSYEKIFPQTKWGGSPGKPHGGKKAKVERISPFAQMAAKAINQTPRSVRSKIKIGKILAPLFLRIRYKAFDRPMELRQLAKVSSQSERERIIEAIENGQAKSVAEAITVLGLEATRVGIPTLETTMLDEDFRTMKFANESVDLVLTAPPSAETKQSFWNDLADFSARVLKPGSFLAIFANINSLPHVILTLSLRLNYLWTISVYCGKRRMKRSLGGLITGWRPLLLFSKGVPKSYESFADLYLVDDISDELLLESSESLISLLIKRLTERGGKVVDPTATSPVTAEVATRLERTGISVKFQEENYTLVPRPLAS